MSENMWGDKFSTSGETMNPTSILREQAGYLITLSGGRLIGELETLVDGKFVVSYLNIRTPNREVETSLIKIRFPLVETYPLSLENLLSKTTVTLDDFSDYILFLKKYLRGDSIQNYIRKLWEIYADL